MHGILFGIALVLMAARPSDAGRPLAAAADAGSTAPAPASETVTLAPGQLIEPVDLARLLSNTRGAQPEVLHVGFPILFRAGHISGSRHIGPASRPEGLQALKEALSAIPPGRVIVLYCGCCPWEDCPNMRPALQLAQQLGRGDVKLLHVSTNLQHDWIDQGFPTSSGDQ